MKVWPSRPAGITHFGDNFILVNHIPGLFKDLGQVKVTTDYSLSVVDNQEVAVYIKIVPAQNDPS